jgi:hypothetical protein
MNFLEAGNVRQFPVPCSEEIPKLEHAKPERVIAIIQENGRANTGIFAAIYRLIGPQRTSRTFSGLVPQISSEAPVLEDV